MSPTFSYRASWRLLPALSLLACAQLVLAQENPAKRPPINLGPISSDTLRLGDTLSAQLKPIRDVQVTPLAAGAIFAFQTRDAAMPTIRIGTVAPTRGPQGREPQVVRWYFEPDDEIQVTPEHRDRTPAAATQHTMRLLPVLSPRTTYHYIISAGAGEGAAQEVGSFSTISRRVRIVFQKIRVLSGGDPDGIGDTFFQFFANHDAQTNRPFIWLGGRDRPLQVLDGATIDANKSLTLHNVDELRLAVNGYDEDFLTLGAPRAAGSATSVVVDRPQNFAAHNNAGAWNVADGTFDLALLRSQGKAETVPFTLASLPTTSPQDIRFEVSGFYTVTPTMSKAEMLGTALRTRGGILSPPETRQPAPKAGPPSTPVRRGAIRIPKR